MLAWMVEMNDGQGDEPDRWPASLGAMLAYGFAVGLLVGWLMQSLWVQRAGRPGPPRLIHAQEVPQ
jgi:hypothetical protein